jgi:hypothetical protein
MASSNSASSAGSAAGAIGGGILGAFFGDPALGASIGSGIGSLVGGFAPGLFGQGSDDLKKLTKRALQPDPLDKLLKSQLVTLSSYALLDYLQKAIEDKHIRERALRIAGFNPEDVLPQNLPSLEGPRVGTTNEKGPSNIFPIPGGRYVPSPAYSDLLSSVPPELQQAYAPVLAALESVNVPSVTYPSKGGTQSDVALQKGLESGTIRPGEAANPQNRALATGIPISFSRKGKDATYVIPIKGTGYEDKIDFNSLGQISIPRGAGDQNIIEQAIKDKNYALALGILANSGKLPLRG